MKRSPRATSAAYDVARGRVAIELHDGSAVAIPVAAIASLVDATADQLVKIRASTGGRTIVLDELGVDISVPSLLHDLVAVDTATAAALMGRKGGTAATDVKASAARTNGAKGGRPLTAAGFIRALDGMVRTSIPGVQLEHDWASATWQHAGLSLYVKTHGPTEMQVVCSWDRQRTPTVPRSRATVHDLSEDFTRAAMRSTG